jgi:hypothetical protein
MATSRITYSKNGPKDPVVEIQSENGGRGQHGEERQLDTSRRSRPPRPNRDQDDEQHEADITRRAARVLVASMIHGPNKLKRPTNALIAARTPDEPVRSDC